MLKPNFPHVSLSKPPFPHLFSMATTFVPIHFTASGCDKDRLEGSGGRGRSGHGEGGVGPDGRGHWAVQAMILLVQIQSDRDMIGISWEYDRIYLRLTSISCSNCSNQQKIGILRGIDLDRWSLTDDWGRHVA